MKLAYNFVQVFYWTGTALIVAGVVFAATFTNIYKNVLKSRLILTKDSELYEPFVNPPVVFREKYYLFNVTNPEEFQWENAKPILQEVGPYTYIKKFIKKNIRFSEDGRYVTFDQYLQFHFERSTSVGDETDLITTINPILVVVGSELRKHNSLLNSFAGLVLPSYDTFHDMLITKPIGQLIYTGYPDDILNLLGEFYSYVEIANGTFAYLKGRNNTLEATYTLETGKVDMDNYMQIVKINNEEYLDVWPERKCNKARGTLGTQVPPFLTKETFNYAFSMDICRSVEMTYTKESDVNGVRVFQYGATDDLFKTNGTCYCKNPKFCADGLIDLKACRNGDLFGSPAQYYRADPSLLEEVLGVNPTKEKHDSYLNIEPTTGIVLEAKKRLQFNLPLDSYEGVPAFEYVNKSMFPFMWIEEGGKATEEVTDMIVNITEKPFLYSYIASGFLILMGVVAIFAGIWNNRSIKRTNEKEKTYKEYNDKTPVYHDEIGAIKLLEKQQNC